MDNAPSDFERLVSTPPGVRLGSIDLIVDGFARNFVLEIGQGRFHGFIVKQGRSVFGYVDSCPHQGVTLARKLDDYITPDRKFIICSWHGALFRIQDGLCVGGPCRGQTLRTWPVKLDQSELVTA